MLRHIVSRRLALALLTGALGIEVALPRTMVAQDQPVAFIHGLFRPGEWQGTANFLAQEFAILPIVPNLGWGNTFETQANNLQGALGTLTQVAALAHSNGGLVERQYVQQFGAGTRINRGFTIGTPHRGAQLAQYARDGTALRYANYLYNSIADPFNFYYFYDPDFQNAVDNSPLVIARDVMEAMAFIAKYLVPIINATAVPAVNTIPVGAEMTPASAFIATLNSSANLSAEAARLFPRVSGATSIAPQNAFFTLFSNDPGSWGQVRRGVEYFALLLYDYYSAHPDFFLQANAWRWYNLAGAMAAFDANWHVLIGSFLYVDNLGTVFVDYQDGLVPLSSQRWPGATKQRELLFPNANIPHRSQLTHPSMVAQMEDLLRVDFGLSLRPTASITGPSTVQPSTSATWTGAASGGTAPYTYRWTVDGTFAGSGSSVTAGNWAGGSSHTIALTVTDAPGHSSLSRQVNVQVSNPPPPCTPQPPALKCSPGG